MSFYRDVIEKDEEFHSTHWDQGHGSAEPVTRAAVVAIIGNGELAGVRLFLTTKVFSLQRLTTDSLDSQAEKTRSFRVSKRF